MKLSVKVRLAIFRSGRDEATLFIQRSKHLQSVPTSGDSMSGPSFDVDSACF